jgi:hypothetical protein
MISLSAAGSLASDQAFGRSAVANASASMHPSFRPHFRPLLRSSVARSLGHHRIRRDREIFFPAVEGFPSDGQPFGEINQPISGPISNDMNYTYKYDVPWDWAHRFPPGFFGATHESSSHESSSSVPGCSVQTVTVPAGSGKEQTINMVRC